MRQILLVTVVILIIKPAYSGIIINEVSSGGSCDWIEVKLTEDSPSMDISSLLVTMYYGSNEKIADSTVTLLCKDTPETPYDDRYAVIHFSSAGEQDETDSAGDINKNGIRDLYCDNYGLWNTDSVVSIDTDDDPGNGGIIDFVAFSNRDGTVNNTIAGYMKSASEAGEWIECSSSNPQDCMAYIGGEGLNSYSTLSRKNSSDTNSPEDFSVTPYATPGRDNIVSINQGKRKTAEPLNDRIFHRIDKSSGVIPVKLFVYTECSLKIRIFNAAGSGIYSSDLLKNITPGYFTFEIRESDLKGKILTGLYPVKLEASADGRTEKSTIFLVIIKR